MKYTNEIKGAYKKPTEKTTSDGIHIVRGFKIPVESKSSERTQDHESLSQPSYNTTHITFRETTSR